MIHVYRFRLRRLARLHSLHLHAQLWANKQRESHVDSHGLYLGLVHIAACPACPACHEKSESEIWLLGMFKPTPHTTMVIPLRPGDQADLGPIAKTDYFGKIPEDRIRIGKSAVFFKGDGRERGKIGIPPQRALGVAASWQPDSNTLTIIKTPLTPRGEGQAWPYVDSQWREDVDPYQGDLINAYNDGPPEPGADPLGPFYELESSSPALLLKPEQSHTHIQTTLHLTGPRQALDLIAQRKLGLTLEEIETSLKSP